jgi:hypothetical protein
MSKLKLEMDALQVESFEALRGEAGRGTIHGAAFSYPQITCVEPSCRYDCSFRTCDMNPTGRCIC